MRKEVTAQGKGIEEALENAKAALGAGPLDDVQYDIIELGSKGILGVIGVKPTKIKAYMEVQDKEPVKHQRQHREKLVDEESIRAAIEEDKKKNEGKKKNDNVPEKASFEEDVTLEEISVVEGEDMSYDFITTLIKNLGISAEAKLYKCSDGTRRIIISGKDASTLIGHHGETLDALQYLSNLSCIKKNAKGERDRSRVTLDIEDYRAKREKTLRALARKMADKALRNKKSVVLDPMNAYERRIIHSEIHNIEGVTTNSIGTDNNRKVVIYLQKDKPESVPEEDIENEDNE